MKIINFFLIIGTLLVIGRTLVFAQNKAQQTEWPPGWTEKCLGCICEATSGCNQTLGCLGDYCGMFLISRSYWNDAGSPILHGDDPNLPEAYTRCVIDSYCASRTINQYVQKFTQDCNNDGVLSCDDYARMHYLGYAQCTRNIRNEPYYRIFQRCFQRNPNNRSI